MPGERPNERNDGVLSPSDLDIGDSEYVAEIDEDRYVVSTDKSPPEPTRFEETSRSSLDPEAARYGLDIEVTIEENVSSYCTHSDDIIAVFSDLIRWYATQVDSDLDPTMVLRILIAESDLAIGPPATVKTTMDRHDLTSEDSIGDLLAALSETQNE